MILQFAHPVSPASFPATSFKVLMFKQHDNSWIIWSKLTELVNGRARSDGTCVIPLPMLCAFTATLTGDWWDYVNGQKYFQWFVYNIFSFDNIVGWITSPWDVYNLNPGTWAYVTLYGKRNFADVTKLRVLRLGGCPGLSGWAPCNHKGLYKREAGGQRGEKMLGCWL